MKIGFTGTKQGMTEEQKLTFVIEFAKLNPTELHHGDAIGADELVHQLITINRLITTYLYANCFSKSRVKIVVHPPDNPSKRAYRRGDEHRQPKPYLERNRDIVNDTDMLIACPKENEEIIRSGTWSTVRYCRNRGKPVLIIWPDGSVSQYGSKEEDF